MNGVAINDANRVVFTLVESPAGTFTFTLLDQIDHTPGVPGTDAELTNLSLAGVFTAADFDADPVVINAGASINIENDVPENNGTVLAAKLVVEDGLTGLSTGIGGGPTQVVFTAAELATLVNSGADEPVTIKFNAAVTGDTGLDSKGFDVSWVYVDATHVNGVALLDANRVVFTLVESPAGTFTFTLLDQIDHTPGVPGTDAELTNLSLAGVFTAADFDADPVVIDAGASINIENDVPENNGTVLAAKLVVEDGLTGLSTGIGGGPTRRRSRRRSLRRW